MTLCVVFWPLSFAISVPLGELVVIRLSGGAADPGRLEVFRLQFVRFPADTTSPVPRDLFSRRELQRRRNLHKMCEGRIASRHVSAAGAIVCLRRRYSPSFSALCHCSSDHAAPSRKSVRILRVELSSAAPAAKNGRADFDSLSRLTHCKGL